MSIPLLTLFNSTPDHVKYHSTDSRKYIWIFGHESSMLYLLVIISKIEDAVQIDIFETDVDPLEIGIQNITADNENVQQHYCTESTVQNKEQSIKKFVNITDYDVRQ